MYYCINQYTYLCFGPPSRLRIRFIKNVKHLASDPLASSYIWRRGGEVRAGGGFAATAVSSVRHIFGRLDAFCVPGHVPPHCARWAGSKCPCETAIMVINIIENTEKNHEIMSLDQLTVTPFQILVPFFQPLPPLYAWYWYFLCIIQ